MNKFLKFIKSLSPITIFKTTRINSKKIEILEFLVKNPFLNDVTGIIEVGASYGDERKIYEELDLNVLWIEPLPLVIVCTQ